MVEHNLAKVGVASSNLVSRSVYGWVAEWLCIGLQSRGHRFDSGLSLKKCPGGGIGRRKGLKIPRSLLRAGSSPALGSGFIRVRSL